MYEDIEIKGFYLSCSIWTARPPKKHEADMRQHEDES